MMATKLKSQVGTVGLFLLIGLGILGSLIIKYGSGNKISEGYEITVIFDDASGIIEGGLVRLAGVNIGHVSRRPELNNQRKINVPIVIKETIDIPDNAQFEITPLSMLGDKAIYVRVPEQESSTFIKSGDVLMGSKAKGLESIQEDAAKITQNLNSLMQKTEVTMQKVNLALDEYSAIGMKLNSSITNLNTSILSKESTDSLSVSLSNIEEITSELKSFTKDLQPLSAQTNKTLTSIEKTSDATQRTVNNIDKQIVLLEPSLQKLPDTLDSFSSVAKTLDTTVQDISGGDGLVSALTKDKEVKTDAKTFIKNLKNNGILGYKNDSDPEANDPRDRYRGMRR